MTQIESPYIRIYPICNAYEIEYPIMQANFMYMLFLHVKKRIIQLFAWTMKRAVMMTIQSNGIGIIQVWSLKYLGKQFEAEAAITDNEMS